MVPKNPLNQNPQAKCGAKTKQAGKCKKEAGYGTTHLGYGKCKWHGGSTQSGTVAATKQRVRLEAQMYGTPIDIEPHEALLQEVRRCAGHVHWLGELIATATDPNQLTEITQSGEILGVWMRMYHEERKMLVSAAANAVRAGVAEREVAVAESQARLLAQAVQAILADPDLGLDARQRMAAPGIARRHMLALGEAVVDAEVVES
jgi:hypothetical protein